jgi:hypothetical protein
LEDDEEEVDAEEGRPRFRLPLLVVVVVVVGRAGGGGGRKGAGPMRAATAACSRSSSCRFVFVRVWGVGG